MKNRPNIQTPIPLDQGGTAGTDASSARANLIVPSQTELTDGLNLKEDKVKKGAIDGYAGLNSNGLVPLDQGGTSAGTAPAARTALGLEIGADVQAHGSLLDSLQGLNGSLVEGNLASDGSGVILQKTNLSAGAAPTSGDNFAAGWSAGSTWLHNGTYYLCTGDGVWEEVSLGGGQSSSIGDFYVAKCSNGDWTPDYYRYIVWDGTPRTRGTSISNDGYNLRVRVFESGIYLLSVHLTHLESNDTVEARIIKNWQWTDRLAEVRYDSAEDGNYAFSMTTVAELVANDELQVLLQRTSGSGTMSWPDEFGRFTVARIA
jgi:hypothetical protein